LKRKQSRVWGTLIRLEAWKLNTCEVQRDSHNEIDKGRNTGVGSNKLARLKHYLFVKGLGDSIIAAVLLWQCSLSGSVSLKELRCSRVIWPSSKS
jgi:hypothetical protein